MDVLYQAATSLVSKRQQRCRSIWAYASKTAQGSLIRVITRSIPLRTLMMISITERLNSTTYVDEVKVQMVPIHSKDERLEAITTR